MNKYISHNIHIIVIDIYMLYIAPLDKQRRTRRYIKI